MTIKTGFVRFNLPGHKDPEKHADLIFHNIDTLTLIDDNVVKQSATKFAYALHGVTNKRVSKSSSFAKAKKAGHVHES